MLKVKRFSRLGDWKDKQIENWKSKGPNNIERLKSVRDDTLDAIRNNPIDTAVYAAGDLVIPGILAGKALKKWKGKKGKIAAGALAAYAASPIGLTTLALSKKNKWKEKKLREKGIDPESVKKINTERAKDNEEFTRTGKLKTSRKLSNALGFGAVGSGAGALLKNSAGAKAAGKGALIGGLIGTGLSAGLDMLGDYVQSKKNS